jgi:hypothetical protein
MIQEQEVDALSLVMLAHHCGRQTERFWQRMVSDSRYCFALFRRALADPHDPNSKIAWNLLHRQYERQTMLWVKKHKSFPSTGREPYDLAELALEKMWVTFANKEGKFDDFPSEPEYGLKALLKFLQLCVHSVVMDGISQRNELPLPGTGEDGGQREPATEDVDRLAAADFWQCIHDRLKTDKERIVIDASYAHGLKPRQIFELYGDVFESVREIHRTKENILARLRRDGSLQGCFS